MLSLKTVYFNRFTNRFLVPPVVSLAEIGRLFPNEKYTNGGKGHQFTKIEPQPGLITNYLPCKRISLQRIYEMISKTDPKDLKGALSISEETANHIVFTASRMIKKK